jgi:hypothetical protein
MRILRNSWWRVSSSDDDNTVFMALGPWSGESWEMAVDGS